MQERYGLPYMGSKNFIAEPIVSMIPKCDVFVDLFAGGCAITHRALQVGKANTYYVNDITDAPRLFVDACNGKYKDEKRWISREDFSALKDNDPYIRLCWSFSNCGKSYLYGKEKEPWKKAIHHYYLFDDVSYFEQMGIKGMPQGVPFGQKRTYLRKREKAIKPLYVSWYKQTFLPSYADIDDATLQLKRDTDALQKILFDARKKSGLSLKAINEHLGTQMGSHYFGKSQWALPTPEHLARLKEIMEIDIPPELVDKRLESLQSLQRLESPQSLQSPQSLESLESLQRLQNLESLQILQSLQSLHMHYYDAYYYIYTKHKGANIVCYCDPPYRGTADYNGATFDTGKFDNYMRLITAKQDAPLFLFSEYSMPEDFVPILEIPKRQNMCKEVRDKRVMERLYVHQNQLDRYKQAMRGLHYGEQLKLDLF